jgi:D-arabinose 1-dehydrogenase-like Zn-dependent alcohol dehydrogenase
VEWYESLFLQACGHVLTQSRVANLRRADGVLNLDIAATRDLADSYQRSVALAFSAEEVKQRLSEGADCVLLLLVHEHQFFNTLEKLKRENDVVLSASLRTDARSNDFSNYHVDVALIRKSASGQMNIAH